MMTTIKNTHTHTQKYTYLDDPEKIRERNFDLPEKTTISQVPLDHELPFDHNYGHAGKWQRRRFKWW